jgi:hypothetical protein
MKGKEEKGERDRDGGRLKRGERVRKKGARGIRCARVGDGQLGIVANIAKEKRKFN